MPKIALLVFILMACCAIVVFAQPLVNIPLDDPMVAEAYTFIDRMVLKYDIHSLITTRRPYTYGDVAKVVAQLQQMEERLSPTERFQLEQVAQLVLGEIKPLLRTEGEDYRFDLNFEPGLYMTRRPEPWQPSGSEFDWQVRGLVTGGVSDSFALVSDLRWYIIPEKKLPDTVRAEVEVGGGFVSSGIAPAYGKFRLPWFDLLIGKQNVSWGPGRRGNLLLSANPLPMDMVQLTAQYRAVGFQSLTAFGKGQPGDKVLVAHRLDIDLWNRGNLGIAEAVMINAGDVEFSLINPFTIYAVSEPSTSGALDEEKTKGSLGNLLVSGDLEFRLNSRASLYGELMVDDFQTRLGLQSWRNWGTKFGILAGIYLLDPLPQFDSELRAEYTFVNQYAYTHWRDVSEYTHRGKLVGHEIGPDSDDFWLQLHAQITDRITASLAYERRRHGETDVTEARDLDAPYDVNWEFLSGIPESTHSVTLTGRYHTIGRELIELEYTFASKRNLGHVEGISDRFHELTLKTLYRF